MPFTQYTLNINVLHNHGTFKTNTLVGTVLLTIDWVLSVFRECPFSVAGTIAG